MHQVSPPTHLQELASSHLASVTLKEAGCIHKALRNHVVASATEQTHAIWGQSHLWLLQRLRRGCLTKSLGKRDAWSKRGSIQFVEGVVFLECGYEGWCSVFTSGHGPVCWWAFDIFVVKYSWGQVPLLALILSLSQNYLSPNSCLCMQYFCYIVCGKISAVSG